MRLLEGAAVPEEEKQETEERIEVDFLFFIYMDVDQEDQEIIVTPDLLI